MLSFQIREEITKLLTAFDSAKYFFDCLSSIDDSFPELKQRICKIAQASDSSEINNAANQLRSHLAQTKQRIGEVKPRSFFKSIEELQEKIQQIQQLNFNDLSQLIEIGNKLNEFSSTYERFIDNGYSLESAGKMVIEAREISILLDGFRKGLSFYLSNIDDSIVESEEGRELSIMLPSTMTLTEFIMKLHAIQLMYNELCELAKISKTDYPIKIIKIESGSLFAKIFGHNKVIALLTEFLKSAVNYIYRNYTDEGKLSAIPQKLDIIQSVLEFSKKLESHGIDTREMNYQIDKSSISIAKQLNQLISGQAEITINNSKLSIGNEVQKKLIESEKTLQLEQLDPDEPQSNS